MTPEPTRPEEIIATLGNDWDSERVEANRAAMRAKVDAARRRQLIARAGIVVTAAAAVFALGVWARTPDRVALATKVAPVIGPDDPSVLRFADGSTATLIGVESEVVAVTTRDRLVELRLREGAAVFEVAANADRLFRVVAADVVVEVVGTRFRVERLADIVEVEVAEGVVIASQRELSFEMRSGMVQRFDIGPPEAAEPTDQVALERPSANPGRVRSRPPEAPTWRELARDGAFDAAFDALESAPAPTRVADLMLAADAARFSGNPSEAIGFLRQVRTHHRDDPRAALAAFTEGRILLVQLGVPRQAAAAFADTRVLAPGASFAEDALAREVEARSRAGESNAAARLARQYLEHYPNGRRATAVRHYGGIDANP